MRIRRRHSQSGFTLIEVLVALFILTGAILVISTAWSGNFMRIRKSALYNDAAAVLERKMVEIEAKYKIKPVAEIPETEEGDFGTEHPGIRWVMTSRELELPDLTPILMSQEESPDEMLISMIKQTSEFLSKAIKEVKVSIFIKRGNKELEFAATQYFVDYKKEFALGGGMGGAGEDATETTPATGGTGAAGSP